MPTCEPCGTFYNPNSLPGDGTCPDCGLPVSVGEHGEAHKSPTARCAVALLGGRGCGRGYLGWRFMQGVLLLF